MSLNIDPEVYHCAIPCAASPEPSPEPTRRGSEALPRGSCRRSRMPTSAGPDGKVVRQEGVSGTAFLRVPFWLWPLRLYTDQAYGPQGTAKAVISHPR